MAMDKDEIIKKIKENKTPVFIVSVILVVFIAFSAVRCSAVQESRQAESQPQATASNVVDDEAAALNELTDEQKAKRQPLLTAPANIRWTLSTIGKPLYQ